MASNENLELLLQEGAVCGRSCNVGLTRNELYAARAKGYASGWLNFILPASVINWWQSYKAEVKSLGDEVSAHLASEASDLQNDNALHRRYHLALAESSSFAKGCHHSLIGFPLLLGAGVYTLCHTQNTTAQAVIGAAFIAWIGLEAGDIFYENIRFVRARNAELQSKTAKTDQGKYVLDALIQGDKEHK